MDWPEKIAIYTNPIWYIIVLILVIAFGLTELWRKVIWCNKRWYFNEIDYYLLKRELKKGVTDKEIKNFKSWIERHKSYPNYLKVNKLIQNYESKSKNKQ